MTLEPSTQYVHKTNKALASVNDTNVRLYNIKEIITLIKKLYGQNLLEKLLADLDKNKIHFLLFPSYLFNDISLYVRIFYVCVRGFVCVCVCLYTRFN